MLQLIAPILHHVLDAFGLLDPKEYHQSTKKDDGTGDHSPWPLSLAHAQLSVRSVAHTEPYEVTRRESFSRQRTRRKPLLNS